MRWFIFLALSLPLAAHAQKVGTARAKSLTPTAYLTDTIIPGGVWSWFSDPRAIYVPETGDLYVGALERTSSSAGRRRIAKYSGGSITLGPTNWTEGDNVDDHNNPAIIRMESDTFLVFYADHDEPTGGAYSYWKLSTDTTGSAWSATDTLQGVTGRNTYSNLFEIGDSIYHFFRQSGQFFYEQYIRASGDGGRTWTTEEVFVTNRPDRPYIVARKTSDTRVDFTTTDSHPISGTDDCGLYHFYFQNDTFFTTSGNILVTRANLPIYIDTIKAKLDCVIYDVGVETKEAWNWDVRSDRNGDPIVVYAVYTDSTTHEYYYAKFNGSTWDSYKVCDAGGTIANGWQEPFYSGGITILQDNVLICSREVGGIHSLWRYHSNDGGQTWVGVQVIAGESNDKQFRPLVPIGHTLDSPINVVWVSGIYDFFDLPDWDTVIKYGKF